MIAPLRHRPGELIQDRYEIHGVLGSGAFGTVYKCRDNEVDVTVAVKELHVLDDPATGVDERAPALAQFRSEAQHLSHLRHPHIVSGHYQPHSGVWLVCPVCGRSFKGERLCPEHNAPLNILRQRHYLVMEYLSGPNLSEAAQGQGGILPVPQTLLWMRQIAEALQLIHARGWIHRDVKPENIRLRPHDQDLWHSDAVLLDFGITSAAGVEGDYSTRAQRHTQGGGTFGYAPDAPQERRHPDARSDIHALGMTLYRLLSGRDPQESAELIQLRTHRPREFNAQIPPALEDLILRAIDPNPALRPQTAIEFARALNALSAPTLPDAAPVALPTPAIAVANSPLLVFSTGEQTDDTRQAVQLLDRYPLEAQRFLYGGELTRWFEASGRLDLARRAEEIRVQFPDKREQGVEALLQFTGMLEPPRIRVQPERLDFGALQPSESRTLNLQIDNPGRGHLFGMLRPEHPGLKCERSFEGNRAVVPVTLDARRLGRGAQSGELVIDSSAGELRVPIWGNVRGGLGYSAAPTVVLWAMLGMVCGQLMRAVPLSHQANPAGWNWLSNESTVPWFPAAPSFGLMVLVALLALTVGEATRRKSCAFAFSAVLSSLFFGALCMAMGNELLKAGDVALHPLMTFIAHRWAPGAWMFAGGIMGAIYGTLRSWKALVSPRPWEVVAQIVGGWLFAIAMFYGALWATFLVVPTLY